MPKRSNPFSHDVPQQLKIHIGVKEVDLGVNKYQNMKAVYERTHQLMFGMSQMCNSTSARGSIPAPQNIVNGSQKSNVLDDYRKCCQINGVHKCSFCETCICSECSRVCTHCEEHFCHLCSVMQYHLSREFAICLSCF